MSNKNIPFVYSNKIYYLISEDDHVKILNDDKTVLLSLTLKELNESQHEIASLAQTIYYSLVCKNSNTIDCKRL